MVSLQQGVLLEKKCRFEIGREMHSDTKYLCGEDVGGDFQIKRQAIITCANETGL